MNGTDAEIQHCCRMVLILCKLCLAKKLVNCLHGASINSLDEVVYSVFHKEGFQYH